MPVRLTKMSLHEFVSNLYGGERNFRRIKLPDGSDLSGYAGEIFDYRALNNHLVRISSTFKTEPVDIRDSSLVRLTARGLHLPFLLAEGADLSYTDLRKANLRDSQLNGANLSGANLTDVCLNGAKLQKALLSKADLFDARLHSADLSNADLSKAVLDSANFCNACLEGAKVYGASALRTYFTYANLRGVKGLSDVQNLGEATFWETKVTPTESRIIRAVERGKRFVVE